MHNKLFINVKKHDELFPMPAKLLQQRFDETLKFEHAVSQFQKACSSVVMAENKDRSDNVIVGHPHKISNSVSECLTFRFPRPLAQGKDKTGI